MKLDKQALVEFLKENLTLGVSLETSMEGAIEVRVKLYVDGHEIASESDYCYPRCDH